MMMKNLEEKPGAHRGGNCCPGGKNGLPAKKAGAGAEGVVQDVRAVFYFAAIFVAIGIGLFGWFTRPAADMPLPALPPVVIPPVTS